MSDGMYEKSFGRFFGESDAIIADAEPQFAGIALQLLDIAFAGLGKAVESRQDPHRSVAVDPPDIGSGRIGKDNLLHVGSA